MAPGANDSAFQVAAKNVLSQYENLDEPITEPAAASSPPDAIAAEWDQVNAFREKLEEENAAKPAAAIRSVSQFTPIGYIEARTKLSETAVSSSLLLVRIQRYDFSRLSCTSHLYYKVFGPPEFKRGHLKAERDAIFVMALTGLAGNDDVHQRMLQSIYRRLTGQTEPCPTTGSHWDAVGFQGNNPATDLRGSGIFGLLQILYFAKTAPTLLAKIFSLSQDERQNFPFAIVSLNLTGICLKVLREARIYKLCSARNSVIDTTCILYLALFYDMYIGWKNQGKTIESFPPTRDEIERRARSDPEKMIAAYEKNYVSPLQALTSQKEMFVPE